jgi:hypothetical protein
LPNWSVTVATKALANAVFTVALWPEPDVTTIFAAAPATFVSLKVAAVVTPFAAAVTLEPPATVFAVTLSDNWPLPFVVAVIVIVLLLNFSLAPLDGAVNVTLAPDTALPKLSFTVATKALPNGVFTVVLWPDPEVTTMLAAAPATFVSLKVAAVLTPLAAAVTL